MNDFLEMLRQMRIAIFGSPDYTMGNKAEIMRRLRVLLEDNGSKCTAMVVRGK